MKEKGEIFQEEPVKRIKKDPKFEEDKVKTRNKELEKCSEE